MQELTQNENVDFVRFSQNMRISIKFVYVFVGSAV